MKTTKAMPSRFPTITNADRRRLGALVATEAGRAWGSVHWRDKLDLLLEEAHPVEAKRVPESVVTMNTTVRIVDGETGESRSVTLAYPDDLELLPDAISVLDPLGIALIGRAVGDVVKCSDEEGRWRVTEILYQPEQAGVWRR